jgi:hypothetical protein
MSEISRSSKFLPIKPSSSPEEAQKQLSSSPAQQVAGIEQSKGDEKSRVEDKVFKPVSRSLSDGDIMDQLFKIQRPPNQENKQLLSTMIQHGISANAEAFDEIQTLIKGQKRPSAVRSAVVSYAKGLGMSVAGVDILASYFASETDILANLKKLQVSSKRFNSIVSSYPQLFDPGLFSGLGAIVGEFEQTLKKLMRQQKDSAFSISEFKRGKFIHEYKLFLDFLGGVKSKLSTGKPSDVALVESEFDRFRHALKGLLSAFTSQSILSREMMSQGDSDPSYYYWQLPNPMAPSEQTMELLIRKDKKLSGQARIDSEETQIILRFDTPDLGEVSVIIDLKKNKVSYIFQTDNGNTKRLIAEMSADLRDRMVDLNYEMVKVQTVQKKLDVKKLLMPLLNLDKMTRIIADA